MTQEIVRKLQELDAYLTKLIAAQEGIDQEKITVSYIQEQREKLIYKTKRFDISSQYGGYDLTGLKVLTRQELEAIDDRANRFLASFV